MAYNAGPYVKDGCHPHIDLEFRGHQGVCLVKWGWRLWMQNVSRNVERMISHRLLT